VGKEKEKRGRRVTGGGGKVRGGMEGASGR